ncbi:Integrase core domain-containing protein [Geodermatophilus amargosae]|uniref:Integrase core domain-containing protein n=1 Tax=Geodermatophilus amargosae TaxID=1296565 RepID=A0A1I7D9B2_9ACTN|nr:Integrase core domain-containing protein [Geodermatophilus amargosae]
MQTRLSGQLQRPDGSTAAGPTTTWKGLNKPHRGDRRWAQAWSPQQIARRLVIDFPDDADMRISHEAIYQALYIEGRGALKRELVACLRTGRALRKPRERARNKPQGHVTADVVLSERPAEAADRAVPGHWEGDLIIGLNRSAIGTVVDRTSRYTLLVHLPRLPGHGTVPPVKNGPALGGYGAIAMKKALTKTMSTMPADLLRSLTWDRGKELSAHAQFKIETGIAVYFADPHSPWQRGTNENTNGLLRQYFPKGTDLSRWPQKTSSPSRPRSTADPARSSTGRPLPRSWTNARSTRPVLQRPVETTQYTSRAYAALCAQLGVNRSMGAVGSSADNALAESFNATLKRETLAGAAGSDSPAEARRAVFAWLTRYNTRRRHSACGQTSPIDYEARQAPATLPTAA